MTTPPPYEPTASEQPTAGTASTNYAEPTYAEPNYAQQSYVAQPVAPRDALPTSMAHTNAYAVIAVILAFVQPLAGIIFGHMAASQIKRNGDSGRGLALTALIVGYIYVALILAFVLFYVFMIFVMIGSAGAFLSEFNNYDSLNSF